jgi:hypothetical protein
MPPNLAELADPLTPSADYLIHFLYPKLYYTYRIKPPKKENVKFFFQKPRFPPNGLILKGIIAQFLMAEFQ